MGSPFLNYHEKFLDIKELNVAYHKQINDVLKKCFGSTRSYDKNKIHFGKFALISYLNVTPMNIELNGQNYKVGGICSVSTLPEFRGQGHASALLETTLNWLEEENFDLAVLFAANQKLYNDFGFIAGPENLNKLFTEEKDEIPLVFMVKIISSQIDFDVFSIDNILAWKKLERF